MISKFSLFLIASLVALSSSLIAASVIQIPMRSELRFHPFTKIDQPYFGYVDGATVSVEVGCAPTFDKLFFNYQGNFNIDNNYDHQRCVLYLVGHAPVSEYIDAIASVVFFTSKEDFQPRRVTWTLGRGTFYNSLTGHFYRLEPFIGAWQDALAQCSATPLLNMTGYLATITSNEEMVGIGSKTNMSLWTGLAADAPGPSPNWKWGTGPEKSQTQWIGNSMYEGGMPQTTKVGPAFNAWGRFQPTDLVAAATSDRQYVAIVPSLYENVAYWQNKANTDGVQGFVCEYDDVMNPALASEMQKWAGSVLLEFGCANYTSATECANRASFGCAFSAGVCQQTRCSVHATSKGCAADARCQWNTDMLLGRCINRRCASYSSSATCQLDPACTTSMSGGISTCRDAVCSDAGDSCTCAKIDGCSWRNGKCGLGDTIGCDGMDVIYIFDASSAVDRQFQQFTGGFQALTDMLLTSQFYLTGSRAGVDPTSLAHGMRVGFIRFSSRAETQTPGFGSSGQLTGDAGEAMDDLTYLQQNFAPTNIRALDPALKKAQDMFAFAQSYTTTARARTIVVITAGPLSDNPTTTYQALVSAGVKVVGVAIRPQFPPSIDTIQTSSTLMTLFSNPNAYVSTVMARVKTDGIYAICDINTTLGNTVASTGTRDLCRHNVDVASCTSNSVCAWSYSADMCVSSQCLQYCNSNQCATDRTCSWQSATSTCEEACPSQSVANCGNNPFCWVNPATNKCQSYDCVSNPTEDACIADVKRCVYNASNPVKCTKIECDFDSSADCLNSVNGQTCSWNNKAGICFRDPCKIAGTNRVACSKNAECKVDGTGMCVLHACAVSRTETQCNFDFNCFWDVSQSPPACMPADCTRFNQNPITAESQCRTMPNKCAWVPPTGGNPARCEVIQCGFQNRSCDCAKLPQCVWRNDQCKDSVYVQCPAIDVVFAIEGTPGMSKAFGRHPNGFIGIVESIRSWSRDAPMTTDPAGTGFRMGISAYGPLKTTWVVNSGVGAGNDLTGSPAEWLDANRMLSDIEDTQTRDKEFAGLDVAILPALKNARAIFEAHQAGPARTKMLVVIGNSPITDGGAQVRQEIAALEALGVQVFTNVVRRFSAITPLDTQAAEFMMPLSSDAMSAHFMFTTIDDLRATLLDKFCDPSSNTGKALRISRDRTLPCNWLVGPRECNMQGTCFWNATGTPTCPTADGCPNMGCVALPATLKGQFTCANCQLQNGAFSCSGASNFVASPGLCVQTPCMSNCGAGNCNAASACTWKGANTRCERNWCKSYTDLASCNADSGCVWDEFDATGAPVASGTCRQSACWSNRAYTSCSDQSIIEPVIGKRSQCLWQEQYSPAICSERTCDALQETDCKTQSATCSYDSGFNGRKCQHVECASTNGEECEIDSNCFWDPYAQKCNKRTPDCKITGFSKWTPCTSSCGKGITYKARRIVQFPADTRDSIKCDVVLNAEPEPFMVVTRNCKNVAEYASGWFDSCTDYCAQFNADVASCVRNMNCNWVSIGSTPSCQPKPSIGCETMDQASCLGSDMCLWSSELTFCLPAVTQCRYNDMTTCNSIASCAWRTGANAFTTAAGMGLDDVSLFNPGQKASFVFPSLAFVSADAASTSIGAASVMIENNYQSGKDKLDLALPTDIQIKWIPSSGMLQLTGVATVADYAAAISLVTFETTSTRTTPRTITYSLGVRVGDTANGTSLRQVVYSASSGHSYIKYSSYAGNVTYIQAAYACQNTMLHGRRGYLATVGSPEENDVISTKLEGSGWIGADDTSGRWKWSQGATPDQTTFWVGGSSLGSGLAISGEYNHWFTNDGEPTNDDFQRQRGLYLGKNSFWYAKKSSDAFPTYVCEYGGLVTDTPTDYPMGGSRLLGAGGCVPPMCSWHINRGNCTADPECEWMTTSASCVAGCLSRSTASECSSSTSCFWDITTFPATCQRNPCDGLGYSSCKDGTTSVKCYWDVSVPKCALKTGCAAISGKPECDRSKTCEWFEGMGGCLTKPCTSLLDGISCGANPLCDWRGGVCLPSICKATDAATCAADGACLWSNPVQAGYMPGGEPIHPFEGTYFPPNDAITFIDGITIRITQGYHQGLDMLSMDQVPQMRSKFTAVWLPTYGTLLLTAAYASNPVTALEAYNLAKKYISFATASSRPNARQFIITYGLAAAWAPYANPVGSETKILKQVDPDKVYATVADANARCWNTTYFGARGMLAEPDNETANIGLRSVQARGWIGAKVTSTGVWRWNHSLTSFWRLQFGMGLPVYLPVSTPASIYEFAQWASGQPVQGTSGAMVINEGFWISVTQPNALLRGIVCEYNSSQMTVDNFYGIVLATPKGCYPKPCSGLPEALCKKDSSCIWGLSGGRESTCTLDERCAAQVSPALCSALANCYWDHGLATCATAPATACKNLNVTECGQLGGCSWNSLVIPEADAPTGPNSKGACVSTGCSVHPTKSSCFSDPLCRWYTADSSPQGLCIERLCGYTTQTACWMDPKCIWNPTQVKCVASQCIGSSQTDCNNLASCQWDSGKSMCLWQRCSSRVDISTTDGFTTCLWDPTCLAARGKGCYQPTCSNYVTQAQCNADPACFYFSTAQVGGGTQGYCSAAQCTSQTSTSGCGGTETTDPCRWDTATGLCRQASPEEMSPKQYCVREIEPNLSWLYATIVVILLLLAGIIYRVYLAYAKGLNFFDPARKNIRFNAHSRYAAELYNFAQETGVDNNSFQKQGQQQASTAYQANDATDEGEYGEYSEEEHPDL